MRFCPVNVYGANEMERRFLTKYNRIKYLAEEHCGQVCFVRNPALHDAGMV